MDSQARAWKGGAGKGWGSRAPRDKHKFLPPGPVLLPSLSQLLFPGGHSCVSKSQENLNFGLCAVV